MKNWDFSGQRALVTGGASGIGNAAARLLLEAGAEVCVTGTRARREDYDDIEGSNLDNLSYMQLDLSSPRVIRELDYPHEALDLLINAVGTVAYKGAEFEPETFRQVMETNLNGVFDICTKLRPKLATRHGRIVNVGSIASFRATKGNPAYSASKGGLLTLTRSLAQAWARDGIRVNLVAPGYVKTKMTRATWGDEDRLEQSRRSIPLGRWGSPDEIANIIAFLGSDQSSYVTGEMIVADGGMTI